MKIASRFAAIVLAVLVAGLIIAPAGVLSATKQAASPPAPLPDSGASDVVVRIRDAKGLLKLAENMAESSDSARKGALREMLDQQFGGVDWIDPKRSIVLMSDLSHFTEKGSKKSFMIYGIAPFAKKSEKFREAMNASTGRDYYLFTYPAGGVMNKSVIAKLLAASKAKCPDMLTVDIPLAEVMAGVKDTLDSGLEKALKDEAEKSSGSASGPSREQMLKLGRAFFEFLGDVKTLSIGLNSTDDKSSLRLTYVPAPGSALAEILAQQPGTTSILAGYSPQGQIFFRTRSFDYDQLSHILQEFYAKAGIDLSCNVDYWKMFTGEYAGGASFGKGGLGFEGMMVLKKDGEAIDALVEKWVECSNLVYQSLKEESDRPEIVRGADTTVAGRKAVGISVNIKTEDEEAVAFSIRAALSGRIMVMAPDDARLAALLAQADKMSPAGASGPLAEGGIHLADLVSGVASMEGDKAGDIPAIKGPADVHFSFVLENGRGESLFWVNTKEMKDFFAQIDSAKKSAGGKGDDDSWSDIETGGGGDEYMDESPDEDIDAPEAEQMPAADDLDPRAAALLEKGNIVMLYGGPEQALEYYKRALKIEPESGQVHFAMAMAYADLKKFDKAVSHADKALAIHPDNPEYLYGKARIYLMSGDEEKARQCFKDAADKGSAEARRFLERMKWDK